MGEDDYYEVLELQDSVEFFIPTKEEFLKYVDELYVGWNESAQRLAEFLEQNARPRDPTCSVREIVEGYMFGIKIELKNAEKIDRILFYLKPPRSNQEKRRFLKKIEPLAEDVSKNVRAWRYRGHTMVEVPQMSKD